MDSCTLAFFDEVAELNMFSGGTRQTNKKSTLLKNFLSCQSYPPFLTSENTLKICQSTHKYSYSRSALAEFQKPARCAQIIQKKSMLQLLTLSA